VFYADGGDGAGSESSGNAGDGAGDTGGQGGKVDDAPKDDANADPAAELARLRKELTDARAEAGKARTTAKANAANEARQSLAQEIGKALGLVQDDKPADPAELTRTITEKTGRIGELETTVRTQAAQLAIIDQAEKHGGSHKALRDSVSFMKSVEGLDPNDKDFTTKLDDAIKAAVESNAQLRTGQVPRRGGGDFAGGPGTSGRPTSLQDAVSARLGG
jgi:hypothetical protein